MVAGGLLSLAGSLAGTLPFVWFRSHAPTELVPKILGGIALRLSVVISLALAAALSGLFAHAPLLIWVAISHAGLLAADTFYARRQFSGRSGKVALASF